MRVHLWTSINVSTALFLCIVSSAVATCSQRLPIFFHGALTVQGPVARCMVSGNHLFRSIETYTFLWWLTLVSGNHASRNFGQEPISRKSRIFSSAFRVTQFSLYLQSEGVSRHLNFAVILIFIPFTTHEKTSFPEEAGRSFTNGFSGPKRFRTFEKRAPGDYPWDNNGKSKIKLN